MLSPKYERQRGGGSEWEHTFSVDLKRLGAEEECKNG